MRKFTAPILLALAALLLSPTEGWSLPPCPGSPTRDYSLSNNWTNCAGTYTFANGHKYVGKFEDGNFNGQGTLTSANGDKYVGEFEDGNFNGQGTLTYADGTKYVGEWRNDKYHGQGTYTYANSSKYVGEWRNNKRNGQGTYTYANGTKYVGEWRNNKRNGQGTYTYADGRVQEGIWKDNNIAPVSNVPKVNLLYRVIDEAIIRKEPAKKGEVVKRKAMGRILRVTQMLPSGWYQVSEEGEPIGWVHSSSVEKRKSRTRWFWQ